jgi:hypothetical protein
MKYKPIENYHMENAVFKKHFNYHNPSLGPMTKARVCKGAGQE